MKVSTRYAPIVGIFLLAASAPLAAQQDGEQGAVVAEEVEPAPAAQTSTAPSTMDNVVEKSKELMDAGAQAAEQGWEKTKEVSGEVWEGTKKVSGQAWDKTKEVSGKAVEATKETAAKVGAAAKAGYEAAKESYVTHDESESAGAAGAAGSAESAEAESGAASE